MNIRRPLSKTKRRIRAGKWVAFGLVAAALVGVDLMFYFWPFRYREVHPLLESIFESQVEVHGYHRTYFPHPGFVAEHVTFYRHGDRSIPPLATIDRMQVVGHWTTLLFHPHRLNALLLEGLRVQIPPPGTKARGMDFDGGVISTSESEMRIETIAADGTTLDFLQHGQPPLRFQFRELQILDVERNKALGFVLRVKIPGPPGTVVAQGHLGPFNTKSYSTTPLTGTYQLLDADLSRLAGVSGHATAEGRFGGTFMHVNVEGKAAIPDFRAGSAHQVRFDSAYHLVVNGNNGDVQIVSAEVKSGTSTITASGSVAGSPKKVDVMLTTTNGDVNGLLRIVDEANPEVAGKISFHAAVEYQAGPGPFLKRVRLQGNAALAELHFVTPREKEKMDAFSARVSKDDPRGAKEDPPAVTAQAESDTRFDDGMAYFPDIQFRMPGARAHLHGTFNLLDAQVHLTGKVALQRSLPHAVTGWKAVLLKPLAPFFRHKHAGAVVPIAVTGTAEQPKIGEDVLHDK
ncbi:MAG: AsmA-like C-terminal region-containing protein [Acidobacteriaceae bacterium]